MCHQYSSVVTTIIPYSRTIKLQYTLLGDYWECVRPARLPVLTWVPSSVPPGNNIQDTFLIGSATDTTRGQRDISHRCLLLHYSFNLVHCVWNVMAHAQKPDFVFWRNGGVHLNRRGHQFIRLLAAEVCPSAVEMLDTPCSEVVWRVLATHSIRMFPLHFPPVRHRVPSHLNWTLPSVFPSATNALLVANTNYVSSLS